MKGAGLLRRLTPFDRKLALLLALLVVCSFWLPLRQQAGARVVASLDGQTVFVAELDQDQQFELAGPLGPTRVEIADRAVRVLSSPCPNKICIGLGWARHAGDLLACVPNRLVIRIEGEPEEAEYDLLSR